MIASLLEVLLDGHPLHQEEVLGICGQLFAGTTVEITPFLGNVVQSLLEHPGLAEELRAAPDLIPGAIEEMLRYYPPIPATGPRRATMDVEVGERLIRKGQRVIPVMASANRDETVFADPDQFDPATAQPASILCYRSPHLSWSTPLSTDRADCPGRIALAL